MYYPAGPSPHRVGPACSARAPSRLRLACWWRELVTACRRLPRRALMPAVAADLLAASLSYLLCRRPWRTSRAVLFLRARLVRRAASVVAHRALSLPAHTAGLWRARCCRRALCDLGAGAVALQAVARIAGCPFSACAPREAGGLRHCAPRLELSRSYRRPSACALLPPSSALHSRRICRAGGPGASRSVLLLRARLV